jgi:hypothetical protein
MYFKVLKMSQHSITLEIPPALYERLETIAEENQLPIENLLLESLSLMFGEWELDVSQIDQLNDEQLWAIVQRGMPWYSQKRLQELSSRAKEQDLSVEEETELDQRLQEYDAFVLCRSQALLLLKERRYPVDEYLQIAEK